MAIARDNSAAANLALGTTTITWSQSISGSDRILFAEVVVVTDGGSDNPLGGTMTGTYDGVAMTQIGSCGESPGAFKQGIYLFKLENPNTGTNACIFTVTGLSPFALIAASSSYTGYTGSVAVVQNGTAQNTNDYSVTLTPTTTNGWTILVTKVDTATFSAGTNSNFVVGGASTGDAIFDSNGTVSSGSPLAMHATTSGAQNWVGVMANFGPAGGGGGGNPWYAYAQQ